MSDNLLELVSLLTSDDQYKQKLAELQKRIADAKVAEDKANKAKEEAAKFIAAADFIRKTHHGELEARKREHDVAAREAADRIRVGNEQTKELLALKAQINEREEDMRGREEAWTKRSRELNRFAEKLDNRETMLRKLETEHAEKRRKAEAFLNA